jgi:hypothetical protein
MRTARHSVPAPVPVNNNTEYKGQLIEALEQPEGFYVVYATIQGVRRRARNMEHAKQLIDTVVSVIKEPELHPGGWVKNPPFACMHQRIDRDGLWTESVMCAFFCMDSQCPSYIMIMGTRKKPTPEKPQAESIEIQPVAPVEIPRINRRRR